MTGRRPKFCCETDLLWIHVTDFFTMRECCACMTIHTPASQNVLVYYGSYPAYIPLDVGASVEEGNLILSTTSSHASWSPASLGLKTQTLTSRLSQVWVCSCQKPGQCQLVEPTLKSL